MGKKSVGLETWVGELKLAGYRVRKLTQMMGGKPVYSISHGIVTVLVQPRVVPFDWPWSVLALEGPREINKDFDSFEEMAEWVNEMLRCDSL
jgi:hypothetical protein